MDWIQQFTKKIYQPGDKVFASKEYADTCLYILSGTLYQTSISNKTGNELKINELKEGSFVDGLAFKLDKKRDYSCYASERTECIEISSKQLKQIDKENKLLTERLLREICESSHKEISSHLKEKLGACELDENDKAIDNMVSRARIAQYEVASWSDDKLDKLIKYIASAVADSAWDFAESTVEETGIGAVADKVHKLSLVHDRVVTELVGTKTIGRLEEQGNEYVIEYASPVGVIFAVIPVTNPVPNSLFKLLLSIKTRNALIVSYPGKAVKTGTKLVNLVRELLTKYGAPKYLFQSVPLPTNRQRTLDIMRHQDVNLVLATGGSALVKAAHSSGNPVYGVGPGNVPTLVCSDADVNNAASMIISSKSYDNGIICGSESNLVIEKEVYSEFCTAMERYGAAILTGSEKEKALSMFFNGEGGVKKNIIGKNAKYLAQLAGIQRDYEVRVLVILADKEELHCLGGEKMAPILAMFCAEKSISIKYVVRLLEFQGAGHTAVIHSKSIEKIDQFAEKVPVARLLVNTPSTFGMMGVSTKLPLSFMLGSGTWGKNITTENITWKHFLNIKKLAFHANEVIV